MTCSGREPSEGKEELGEVVVDFEQGGGRSEGVGALFKAVTQAVLLFGAETWVLTPMIERNLSSFQHKITRQLTGRQPRRQGGGSWENPSLEESMVESGFKGIRKYFTWRQNTVARYILTRPILDLCERSSQRPGESLSRI